jgi:S1-C subfamily serine protease
MIRFGCPVCKTVLQAPEGQAGSKVGCARCGQRLQVPARPRDKTILGTFLPAGSGTPSAAPGEGAQPAGALPPPPQAPPPGSERPSWYYNQGGQQRGPVTLAELRQLASSGLLGGKDLVWTEGMAQWLAADAVPGLTPGGSSRGGARSRSRRWLLGAGAAACLAGLVVAGLLFFDPWAADAPQAVQARERASGGSRVTAPTGNAERKGPANPKGKSAGQEAKAPPRELTTEEVVARCEKSVALIKTPLGFGTGFVVQPNVVVTNAHVVKDGATGNMQVFFPSAGDAGKKARPVEQVLHWDSRRDLAVLAVQTPFPPLKVAAGYQFKRGQKVTVIGNPGLGQGLFVMENAVSQGVTSTEANLPEGAFYQLNVGINGGNSGGPVLNSFGEVIGVIQSKARAEEAMAFSIPVGDLEKALEKVKGLSAEGRAQATASHNARVVFRRTSRAGLLYRVGVNALDVRWTQAVKQFGNVQPAELDDARQRFLAEVKSKNLLHVLMMDDVKSAVTRVGTDTALSETTRQRLAELWNAYEAIVSDFGTRGGDYNAFRASAARYSQQLLDLIGTLRVVLGVEEEELRF